MEWLKWLLFEMKLFSPELHSWIGLLASLACFAITVYFAKEVKDDPTLFTVLALFACAWVAIASVYELPSPHNSTVPNAFKIPDRFSDLWSFLMVFAGAILAREGQKEHWFLNSRRLQVAAMSLFAALVIPRQFMPEWIQPQHAELALGTLLTLVGFLALGMGAKAVAERSHLLFLTIILVVYAALEIGRTSELILIERRRMSDFFMLSFAMAKLLLTPTFCYIVLRRHSLPKTKDVQA